MNADPDLLALLAHNLLDLSRFFALGVIAGVAFPLALLCKRNAEMSGHYLPDRPRQKRLLAYGFVIGACAALPLTILYVGRWLENSHNLQGPHAVAMILASAATITYLLKRWYLIGDGRSPE
jgi:hypothetical protein